MTNLEQALEQAGIRAVVRERQDAIVLSGAIDSHREREVALEIIRSLEPNKQIIDNLEVVVPPSAAHADDLEEHHGDVISNFGLGGMDSLLNYKDMETNLGDDAVADAISHLMREDPATANLDVTIAVNHGHVRLTGEVPAREDAAKATELAGKVPGVLEIHDELNVKKP